MNADQITGCQRFAGQVKRYHTWPVLREQTVAEHTWQIMRIFTQLFGAPDKDVYTFILYHDAGEISCGDLPFPVKAKNELIKREMDKLEDHGLFHMGAPKVTIGDEMKIRVKICDLLEMWEYGKQELAMGNKLAIPIVERTAQAIFDMTEQLDRFCTGEGKRVSERIVNHMKEFNTCTT